MSFAEFDLVNCNSQSMLKVLGQLNTLASQVVKSIVIVGCTGSGRKTFARFIQKKFSNLSCFEIVETIDLVVAKDYRIHVVSDISDLAIDHGVIVFQMPALIERKDDLIGLADFFIQVHALMNGKSRILVSEKAKEKILAYPWPGQFPELEKVLENAVKKSIRNVIEPEHLNLDDTAKDLNFVVGLKLENVERQYILQTLFFVQQNRTRAAEVLGISIRTLRNKLNQYRQEGHL